MEKEHTEEQILVESFNRDSSCERFTDEELKVLISAVGEMEPIVYEIEERNMLKRTIAESDFCTVGTPFRRGLK